MSATDDYATFSTPPGVTCRNAAAVSPSDSVDLANVSRFLVVGVAGNLNVVTEAGQTVVIPAAAGIPLPIAVSRVKLTSTTATGIVALW
jgi:hypothetical protein